MGSNLASLHSDKCLWFTLPIAILLAIAAGGGLLTPGLYRDSPYYVAQAVGQDFTSLVMVLPTLIISAILASRGSQRARLIWLGGLVYLVYTYVVAAFDSRFNSLFLVYVALLGCSLYALMGGLVAANRLGIKQSFTNKTPVRSVSIYLAVLVVLFYFLWLSEIVPALIAGAIPQSIQDNGTTTNAIHVLDMAWILPGIPISALGLFCMVGAASILVYRENDLDDVTDLLTRCGLRDKNLAAGPRRISSKPNPQCVPCTQSCI